MANEWLSALMGGPLPERLNFDAETVKALCSHERSLTGSTYDFYCRDALPTYARDTEDLLSFLSWIGILPSTFENGVIGVTYTAAAGGREAPEGDAAAEAAAAEEEGEDREEVDEDAEATATAPKKQRTEKLVELSKADLEKTAFLGTTDSHRGVLIKSADTGLWEEDPQIIATLRGWSVTNVKAAPGVCFGVRDIYPCLVLRTYQG
ncbi:hypothetical protein EMIHUDRAFT_465429 [Emiliania huxleyi CCMP1516]|uniref:Uncharacterized protein n=2 Tax=Emiliania huxleyi TaxID=2903 RepID=A0A0D3IDI6_EMIH1|nr:hypothetical protein EMIHUDRAFT_465429 [Emiliania huxleyi CCMP1516]EOD09321.1 hypothetical protein EMIHUDRAFT_465429 [Emiliania huxleyi CCMP1516]|eukprot:XP_005761750.1 hypothetical protein EMIHUDRAFT_465429 [Emiliania huxleyi CCMP1516]